MTSLSTAQRAEQIRKEINKALKADVLELGNHDRFVVRYIKTGVLPIDILLQGGLPRNRFTMIQGDWSTLKSYIGYCAIRECQLEGGVAALIDTEKAFDPLWAVAIGIDVDALLIERPENGELAIDVAEAMTRAGVDLIVFDSVAATLPQAEQEKRLYKENIQPGRQAALFSAACRRLTTANSTTAYLWINQLRENIGMSFGPREKATGGRALPFYSSFIVEIKKVGRITKDDQLFTGEKWQSTKVQVGQKFKAELLKSKLNKPFREAWFNWSLTDSQIDNVSYLCSQGLELGLVKQKGNSWSFSTTKAVGREKFFAAVAANPNTVLALEAAVRGAHGLERPAVMPVSPSRKPKKLAAPKRKTLVKR